MHRCIRMHTYIQQKPSRSTTLRDYITITDLSPSIVYTIIMTHILFYNITIKHGTKFKHLTGRPTSIFN